MRQMKNSGVEWIGQIPDTWDVRKISSIVPIVTDFVASGSFADLREHVQYLDQPDYAMLVRTADLSGTRDNTVYISKESYEFLSNSNLFGGEIILSNIGSVGNVFCFEPMYPRCSLAPNAIMLNGTECNRYLYYWFLCPTTNEALKRIGSHAVQSKFNKTQLKQMPVLCPPLAVQRGIVAYLDCQCELIDSIIDKTKSSIEEYKKLKQAIITQAVTKGVHGDRPMKDSGIDWIGEIPDEWNVSKIRYIGKLQNGISKGSEFFGEGWPFVSYGDVYKNYSLPRSVSGLVNSNTEEQQQYSVSYGDIFFTRTSETIEEVGFSAVCEETIQNAVFAGFVIRLRPYNVDSKITTSYAKYYFRSEHIRKYLVKEMNLVTRASLGQTLLNSIIVLLPSKTEQNEIAIYLDSKCSELDELIIKKEKLIAELESYKKSMIYEYVTGKKEICS